MQDKVYHGQVDHSFTAGRQRLVVLAQTPIFAEPSDVTPKNCTIADLSAYGGLEGIRKQ
jgi:hypothetical protein